MKSGCRVSRQAGNGLSLTGCSSMLEPVQLSGDTWLMQILFLSAWQGGFLLASRDSDTLRLAVVLVQLLAKTPCL